MKPAGSSGKRLRTYSRYGLTRLKRALYGLDVKRLDRRYRVGRASAEWRDALIKDLGGKENVSIQQAAIVDLATRSKLLLDSIDNWLLQQPSLVNARKRALLPVVRERTQLADSLARYLGQLGLEKRVKVKTLAEILAGDGDEGEEDGDQDGEDRSEGKEIPKGCEGRA